MAATVPQSPDKTQLPPPPFTLEKGHPWPDGESSAIRELFDSRRVQQDGAR